MCASNRAGQLALAYQWHQQRNVTGLPCNHWLWLYDCATIVCVLATGVMVCIPISGEENITASSARHGNLWKTRLNSLFRASLCLKTRLCQPVPAPKVLFGLKIWAAKVFFFFSIPLSVMKNRSTRNVTRAYISTRGLQYSKCKNLGLSDAHTFISSVCSSGHIRVILTWILSSERTLPAARFASSWRSYHEQMLIVVVILKKTMSCFHLWVLYVNTAKEGGCCLDEDKSTYWNVSSNITCLMIFHQFKPPS